MNFKKGDEQLFIHRHPEKNHQMNIPEIVRLHWQTKFADWNTDSLERVGVRAKGGHVLVRKDHPVVELLWLNSMNWDLKMSEKALFDGLWYKVSNALFEQCCDELKNQRMIAVHICSHSCGLEPNGPEADYD